MSVVNSTVPAKATQATDSLAIDAMLADWVYHRASTDQSFGIGEIAADLELVNLAKDKLTASGFTPGRDQFIYNIATGFTAAVVKLGTDYIIVFRGVDLAGTYTDALLGAVHAADGTQVDNYDVTQCLQLGAGTLGQGSQASDAINLCRLVLGMAGNSAANVRLVGQSLGGGLAGLVATTLDLRATLIAPAPFADDLPYLAMQVAMTDSGTYFDQASEYVLSSDRTDGSDISRITIGDQIFVRFGQAKYDAFRSRAVQINGHVAALGSNPNISVYRNQGEALTDGTLAGILNAVGADQFKPAVVEYDFGGGDPVALHSPTLHALQIRSMTAGKEFAQLLRQDATLRDVVLGEGQAAIGPVDSPRTDDSSIATTSRVGSSGPNPNVVLRALTKTVGEGKGLYDYVYKVFGTLLRAGTANADAGIHSGVVKLAASALRDVVAGTETVEKIYEKDGTGGKGSWLFAGGKDGSPFADRAVIHLDDIHRNDPALLASDGLAFGESDLNGVVWDELYAELGSEGAVAQVLGKSLTEIFGTNHGDAQGLGWKVAVVQGGGDGAIDYNASKPATGARDGDKSLSHLMVGGAGGDNLVGSGSRDVLLGEGGSDKLYGLTGDDVLIGGAGNDALFGQDGNDVLTGGAGDDSLVGGAGDDILVGGEGADSFFITGGAASITIIGSDPSDRLYMRASDVVATLLDDWFDYTPVNDPADAGWAIPLMGGTEDSDYYLSLWFHHDFAARYGDRSYWVGMNGSLLDESDGTKTLRLDVFYVNNSPDGQVSVMIKDWQPGDLGIPEPWPLIPGEDHYEKATNHFEKHAMPIDPHENERPGATTGGPRADSLSGTGGSDALSGGEGNDTLDGLGGNDTLDGEDGEDLVIGGAGADRLVGGAGSDTASYATASAGLTANLAGGAGTGDASGDSYVGIENLTGTAFADRLSGDNGVNRIDGGSGDDVLVGGANDTLIGGAGRDFYVTSYLTTVDFSGEASALDLRGGLRYLNGTQLGAEVFASGAIGKIIGTDLADSVKAGSWTSIEGGAGNDYLEGGTYSLALIKYGSDLSGGAGDDRLIGSAESNRIDGGTGSDLLTGGAGADRFLFDAGFGQDVITDFDAASSAHDTLVFDHALFERLSSLLAASSMQGADLVIASEDNRLTLQNTQLSALTAANVSFV